MIPFFHHLVKGKYAKKVEQIDNSILSDWLTDELTEFDRSSNKYRLK